VEKFYHDCIKIENGKVGANREALNQTTMIA
jgi:hypothetical protein